MERVRKKQRLFSAKAAFRDGCKKVVTFLMLITLVCGIGNSLLVTEVQAATVSRQYGDVNWDGRIDSIDTNLILQHISASEIAANKKKHPDWILSGDDYKVADVNCDGKIDSRDKLRVLEYIAASTIPNIRTKHPDWVSYLNRKYSYNVNVKFSTDKVNLYINGNNTCKVTVTHNYNRRPVTIKFKKKGTQVADLIYNGWNNAGNTFTFTLKGTSAGSFLLVAEIYDTRKNTLIGGSNVLTVNVEKDNASAKTIISNTEIANAAKKYGISTNSDAYKALLTINTKYGKNATVYNNKSDLLIFMFEGVGNSSKTSVHKNAMCVVVKNGKIKYINRNCTTIPDKPFSSYSHPTLVSGVYRVKAHNHSTTTSNYAALKVYNLSWGAPALMRFTNSKKKTFDFKKNTTSINIHARWNYKLSNNSEGCQLIGAPAFGSGNKPTEYLNFCKATGILSSSYKTMSNKTTCKEGSVKGFYILDRSYGQKYLKNVGYPNNAMPYLK